MSVTTDEYYKPEPVTKSSGPRKIVKTYDYTDAAGNVLYQVVRYWPKDFLQRRPNGNGGWIWNLKGVPRVLYRLPEVAKASEICFCEGEKDCDNLSTLGFVATTTAMGAKGFKKHSAEYAEAFSGKDVLLFPDNDDAGRAYIADVARALIGKAASIKLVKLPDLPEKGDVSDFIATFDGNRQKATGGIHGLISKAIDYQPHAVNQNFQPKSDEKGKQADALIRIGKRAELFQSSDGVLWARFNTNRHFECWPIRAKGTGFRRWLVSEFFKDAGSAPSATAVQSAIEVLEAVAQFGEKQTTREVFTRVAGHEGKIYLDTADDKWRAIEISPAGWKVIEDPPVFFRRTRGMLPLPEPLPGGSLRLLDGLVNLGAEDNRKVILSWLIYTLNPNGPYPLLGFISEQGSGKTSTAKILREIVDPNQSPIRALPKSIEDLAVAAQHSWVLGFDNLSYIPDTFSDALCRLATGGGFATRAHYTNDDEAVFWAKRPVILNGISDFTSRPDLLERTLIVNLPAIPPEKRKTETAISTQFERVRPTLLGALLDAAVITLRNLHNVILNESPRMADFALWSAAAAGAIEADSGEMVSLLFEKQNEALLSDVDSPIHQAVFELVEQRNGRVEMLLADLLEKVTDIAPEEATRQKSWPKNPRALRSALARITPVMRVVGIKITDAGKTKRGRKILIEGDGRGQKMTVGDGRVTVGEGRVTVDRHHLTNRNYEKGDGRRAKGDDSDVLFPIYSLHLKDEKEKEGEGIEVERLKDKVKEQPSPPSLRHQPELWEGEL